MARPLRVEFPGACYHVINRGNFRFPVFGEERDRELILARLVEFAARSLSNDFRLNRLTAPARAAILVPGLPLCGPAKADSL